MPAVTTYCAPCLADLALVREASTAVNGTASCMAHAVLLVHPGDDQQRRRQRLAQLRETATEKLETVGPEERLRLEVLVEEYSLASVMESLVPRRRHDGPRQGGPGGSPASHGGGQGGQDAPLSRSARKRRARERGAERGERGAATAGASPVADGSAEQAGADALEQVGAPSGEPPAPDGGPAGQPDAAPSMVGEAAPAASAPSEAPPAETPPVEASPVEPPPAEVSTAADAPPAEAAGGLVDGPRSDTAPSGVTLTPDPVSPTAGGPESDTQG